MITDMLHGIRRELFKHRISAAFLFMVVTSSVLALGYVTPKSYTSEAVLHAELTNILQPLLRGAAEVTRLDRANEAREVIQSRALLERVAYQSGILTGNEPDEVRTSEVTAMRERIQMQVTSGNYLNISYTTDDPGLAFRVMSNLLTAFMEKSSDQRRSESRGAFEFIDAQVTNYKRQLETAETALKEFRAVNLDGSGNVVQTRIHGLRGNIEDLKLQIEETEAQLLLTREQLQTEEPYREVTVSRGQSNIDRRLSNLNDQLDSQRLIYHDTHPDVTNLRAQIEELEQQKLEDVDQRGSDVVTEIVENPVYETLRLRLSTAETDLQTRRNRLRSVERLLEEEYQRAERIAGSEAEETELMRDYNVTRQVYEEMLERRENARLSMTLDTEGQGVNYRIHEPATYPTQWNGLQMAQFGAAGPVVGSSLVLGVLGAMVMFDQRVRSDRMLRQQLPPQVRLLTAVPQYRQSMLRQLFRPDVLLLVIVVGAFLLLYATVLVVSVLGFEPEVVLETLHNRLSGQG